LETSQLGGGALKSSQALGVIGSGVERITQLKLRHRHEQHDKSLALKVDSWVRAGLWMVGGADRQPVVVQTGHGFDQDGGAESGVHSSTGES
jgi:hypothetical protein